MTPTDWIKLIVGMLPTVVVGMLLFYWQRGQKRRDEAREKAAAKALAETNRRAEARKSESILMLQGMAVIGGMAQATALALKRGSTNGEMEGALAGYEKYRGELQRFLMEQSASSIYDNKEE